MTKSELDAQIESLRQVVEADSTNRPAMPTRPPVQLQIWPEPVRGSPNSFLRSALFAAIQSENRQLLGEQTSPTKTPRGIRITTQTGLSIEYAGVQLDQFDLDVWRSEEHTSELQ